MFVELLDRLRCLNAHADVCLVATATRTAGRDIVEGTLGCPACGAEYAIRGGAAWFGRGADAVAAAPAPLADDEILQLAAMLGIDERGGLFALEGPLGHQAARLSALSPDSRFVLVSPGIESEEGAVLRETGDAIPLARASVRGVALSRRAPGLVDASVRVLGVLGRLVAPADAQVPGGVRVLARDNAWWVGEREPQPTVSAPVTPRRGAPRTGNR